MCHLLNKSDVILEKPGEIFPQTLILRNLRCHVMVFAILQWM